MTQVPEATPGAKGSRGWSGGLRAAGPSSEGVNVQEGEDSPFPHQQAGFPSALGWHRGGERLRKDGGGREKGKRGHRR